MRLLIIGLILIMSRPASLAQNGVISGDQNGFVRGTVYDGSTGESLVGVTILIKGTTTGTITDLDGEFSLDLPPGKYDLQLSYISYQTLLMESIEVKSGEVTFLGELKLSESTLELEEVVVTAEAVRRTEVALQTVKRNAAVMLDGISSARMQLAGDATAVEAARRVTGLSVEDGKYVYVRGLGDRYSKTTLNGMDIPGLDPDRNSLQMDIFPSSLMDNMLVSKNFKADMPADFTGGLVNIETKDLPERKILNVSLSTAYNPGMHLRSGFPSYRGSRTDFLGFDDGTRALPERARQPNIPTPISGADEQEVTDFVKSFNPELAVEQQTALPDISAGITWGNQVSLDGERFGTGKNRRIGYIFSLSYKSNSRFYDRVINSEYQRLLDPDLTELRYAFIQEGEIGEKNVLIGMLGGVAYKTNLSKVRFLAMHLQNGESRAGRFNLLDNGEAVGQSGYIGASDNLEYNQRSLTNVLLHGAHLLKKSGWELEWRLSPTYSTSYDPDIRKTAFTYRMIDTLFVAGAAGNPTRIWRSLNELNATARMDARKKFSLLGRDASLHFGVSHTYKYRDYEILFFDMQFFGTQNWPDPDPARVLDPVNIYPNRPNAIYYQSGNNDPNPNAYRSNVQNTGIYVSGEFSPLRFLKLVLGVRAENFVMRHTGRDQRYASGDHVNGRNLENEKVLESFDFFPTANAIISLSEQQNIRLSWSKTIARPTFKELSFAQILDPISNRIFNGSLFTYATWDGKITETRTGNVDARWEMFMDRDQMLSVSGFYKTFDRPIELVRIPEQQTSTEYQPRNVGDGYLYGLELEVRKDLGFLFTGWNNLSVSGNFTLVESVIEMTETEYQSRKTFEKSGEMIERTRRMAGQSPWVINAGLHYRHYEAGVEAALFFNVKGPTLSIVGVGLYPDIYDEPFRSLNFSLNRKFGENANTVVDFRVSNILNDKIVSTFHSYGAEPAVYSSMHPGRTFSLGISLRF
ncbi:MAG: TonB-dependent receptor domain-containing protein [Bacteroidales bacterium]